MLPPGNLIHHRNHSCDANLWWAGPFDLVARRDIGVGEEITNDYSTSTIDSGFTVQCRCNAETCRGIIAGADAWVHRLDKAYAGHLVPIVINAIESRLSS